LFWCAGVYGDVIRVKIMYNKKDKALVQFADGKQAQLGKYLRGGPQKCQSLLLILTSLHCKCITTHYSDYENCRSRPKLIYFT